MRGHMIMTAGHLWLLSHTRGSGGHNYAERLAYNDVKVTLEAYVIQAFCARLFSHFI